MLKGQTTGTVRLVSFPEAAGILYRFLVRATVKTDQMPRQRRPTDQLGRKIHSAQCHAADQAATFPL